MSEIFCIALSRWHMQMREDKERDDEQIKERHTHGERERARERKGGRAHFALADTRYKSGGRQGGKQGKKGSWDVVTEVAHKYKSSIPK